MKLAFVFVGGDKEPWLNELIDQYQKKIGYFCQFEVIRMKPSRLARSSAAQKLAEETAGLLRILKKDDLVVLCDERGDSLSSVKFSAKLVKLFERGKPRIVVILGGPFGFGDELRERADWTWSLSPLTFSHPIAQAVTLEQVYRAFTIWKGLPYHNE